MQLLWIFVWMSAGIALRAILPRSTVFVRLNRFIIWFSLPATALLALHKLSWTSSYWAPISMAWIVLLASVAFFSAVGKWKAWPRQTVGALILTAGLGNTSFIGFPLLRALYGEHAISVAVLNDQPGSFLALSTVGICCASYFSARKQSVRAVLGLVFRFPPIWAAIFAVGLKAVAFPPAMELFLKFGMATLIPLGLISVGSQLSLSRGLFKRELSPLTLGLFYKLLLAPLLIFCVFVLALHQNGESARISILEAAMGPMITGAIVAREYDLDPSLCSLMVTLGVPLCLLTVPLLAKLLELLAV